MKTLTTSQRSNNILIVDDTPHNLHLLVDILSEHNYKVRPVPNGKLALSAAEINPPDLILLDIMMPGLDGYEVCQQLKSNPQTKDIPVIFISAGNEAVDKVKAFSVGGADYIAKPFQMQEVLMRVKNQLALKSLQQQLKVKNERLNQTISQLKKSQQERVKTQKHLAIAKITAGISHKIDRPLDDIDRTLAEIRQFGEANLQDIPAFLAEISTQQQKYFAALLKQARNNTINPLLSATDRQQLKTKLRAKLEKFQVEDAEEVAEMLIELGFDEEIETLLPLLTSNNYREILDNAYLLLNLDKSVENIAQSSTQVSQVISAFQEYTSSYPVSTSKRQANIKNTVEFALSTITPKMPSGIQIIKHYSDVTTIYCYPEALQKMWRHLIQNAIDAIGTHGILTINIYQHQDRVMVEMIDTGGGIPQKILPKLCDPFFTTKTSADNMGLGLAIAKQIAELHDGKITVNLLSGKLTLPGNTKFTVTLPLVQQN